MKDMKPALALLLLIAFTLGIIASQAYNAFSTTLQAPTYNDGYEFPSQAYTSVTGKAIARDSPGDHVAEKDISVYQDRVILDLKDVIFAKFTPTYSMDPVLDETSNALEVVPESPDDVNEGDIIAYEHPNVQGTIIHRVIKKGEDQLGTYWIVKGDNNPQADPGKVRFDDIKSLVVAIIY